MANAPQMQTELKLAGAALNAEPILSDDNETYDSTQSLIPKAWETPLQMPMDGMSPNDLCKEDRKAYCEQILGNLSSVFRALREQAHVARARLLSDGQNGHPATMESPKCEIADEARHHAIEALLNWYYRKDQDQKETVAYIGAVSATPHTLKALHELNRLKHEFSDLLVTLRDALDPLSNTRGDMHDIFGMLSENAPVNLSRKAAGSLVRHLLHSKLNIRQLVRTIPIVDELPYSIRWRWIDSPSSVRIDRVKLLDMLERKYDHPESRYDFETVAGVTDPDFCLKKGQSNDLRISIKLSGTAGTKAQEGEPSKPYLDFKSRLPVFYEAAPADYYRKEPTYSIAPANAPKRKRKGLTESEPFLMTLPVHRYKKNTGSAE